ncbi:MarR family transcriptional regulator [Roseburia intestinalis]|uniref:MarR family transcriptional regulator n=1 Tax=Roseburia intestinalis TaxID=166486 RepID=UPI0001CD6AC1|nr:helix-turn-helix domain-containing protein [Roseburia intestinalis]CBL10744.1 Iron dependent repressor, N-terminal DNA binding domain [Roseburia intestinalis M50/1]
MTAEKIKRMLDACYLAKRIRELLPELPEGVTPAYIQYMDVIHSQQESKERVKVSDISDTLKLPRPGVTRTVKEMEKKGLSHQICIGGRWENHICCDYRKR